MVLTAVYNIEFNYKIPYKSSSESCEKDMILILKLIIMWMLNILKACLSIVSIKESIKLS